jgi:hypothetical protein
VMFVSNWCANIGTFFNVQKLFEDFFKNNFQTIVGKVYSVEVVYLQYHAIPNDD